MVRLLIIADDFTGALDTGVQFKKRGISTEIFTRQSPKEIVVKPETEVLVIDTETRPLSAKEAYEEVKKVAQWAYSKNIPLIFKKTDSALRGNIGAELEAVVDAAEKEILYFLPAYPEMNRITKNGTQYISGKLLEKTVFGKDPFEPATVSYIPSIIGKQSKVKTKCISCEEKIPKEVGDIQIFICDAIVSDDMSMRVDELYQRGELRLVAGCAGLGDYLAESLPFHRKKEEEFCKTEGMYVACGSLNQITKRQLDYAERNGDFLRRHLTMEQKLLEEYDETPEGEVFLEEILSLCKENKKLIVDTFDCEGEKEEFLIEHQIQPEKVRELIAKAHGRIVLEIMKRKLDITVLMTGSDTLMGYMNLIGCRQIEPLCEIEPGIAVSQIIYRGHRQQVISKSGGFGTEDILCRIAEKIVKEI